MTRAITDYKVLTFDCYGTLIDWEGGIWDALQPLWLKNGCDVERETALRAFAETESAQQAATPGMLYPELLTHVHHAIARKFGLTTETRAWTGPSASRCRNGPPSRTRRMR